MYNLFPQKTNTVVSMNTISLFQFHQTDKIIFLAVTCHVYPLQLDNLVALEQIIPVTLNIKLLLNCFLKNEIKTLKTSKSLVW